MCKGTTLHRVLESALTRNGSRWFRFVLGILKNEADAEEALQEAFRRVLSRNRSFPSEEQARMYLARAVGNTAYEMYNSRKRERGRTLGILESAIPCDVACSPDNRLEQKEEERKRRALLDLLHDGLKQLPLKYEEALKMTILESGGASLRQVGLENNIPYSTLRHRHRQGLIQMRKFLEKASKVRTSNVERLKTG